MNKADEMLMAATEKQSLPKDFKKWLDTVVWKNKHKLIFWKVGKDYFGYCQLCKTDNIALNKQDKILAGKSGRCPNCNKKIIYRNANHSKSFSEKNFVSFFHKVDAGYMLRTYRIYKWTEGKGYKYIKDERERRYWIPGQESQFFHQLGCYDWNYGFWKNYSQTLPDFMHVYPKNITQLFKDPRFKFSALKQHVLQTAANPIEYLREWQRLPQLEILTKLKLSKLVVDIICKVGARNSFRCIIDIEQKNLKGFLRLENKENIKFLIKHNLTISGLETLQYLEQQKVKPTIQLLQFVNNHVLRFVNLDTADSVVAKFGLPGLYHYAKQQGLDKKNSHFMNDYMDYYKACLFLKYDMSDTMFLKPKNFKSAHDRACNLQQQMQDKKLYAAVKRKLNKYLQLSYYDKKYSIVMPKRADDIILEGKQMSHCVGSYLTKIKEGRSVICFVRHSNEPDKCFYTLELNPITKKIVQCRGYDNEPTPEEKQVQKFVKQWKEKIVDKKFAEVG